MVTRLELAVILVLAGFLSYLASQAQAEMELAQVDIIVRNIRTGLQIAVGERIMRGEDSQLAGLLEANPLKFLGQVPNGYIGETAVPDGPGTWRFDPATHLLEYRPLHPGIFGGRRALHWQLRSAGSVAGRPVGLRLEAD